MILSADHDPPLNTSYHLPGVCSLLLTPHPLAPQVYLAAPSSFLRSDHATLCLWLEPGCGLREGWDRVRAPCDTLEWGMAAVVPALGWQQQSVLSG